MGKAFVFSKTDTYWHKELCSGWVSDRKGSRRMDREGGKANNKLATLYDIFESWKEITVEELRLYRGRVRGSLMGMESLTKEMC